MLDVRDYGATGDGVADDTAAIQAALTAAHNSGGGTVYVPAGSYRLTSTLIVRANTTITAHGAYLFADGAHKLLQNADDTDVFAGDDGHGDITVEGGVWDGRGQLAATDQMYNVLGFVHARRITVRDLTVRNVAGYHAVELNSIDGGRVDGCRFEGFVDNSSGGTRQFSEAIQLDVAKSGSTWIGAHDDTHARDIVVRDCHMGPALDGSGLGPFGALVGSHSSAPGQWYDGIRVIDNHVDGALLYGVRGHSWRDPVIGGNQIRNTAGTSIYLHDGQRGVIVGNAVTGSGSNGVNVTNQPGALVEGNVLVDPQANYCVYIEASDDVQVNGNLCHGGPTAGIRLGVGADKALVIANTIRRGSGGASAVSCNGGSGTKSTVSHNDLTGYGTGSDVIKVQSGTIATSIGSVGSIGQNVA